VLLGNRRRVRRRNDMPSKKSSRIKLSRSRAAAEIPAHDVQSVLAALERLGTKSTREGMARFGIQTSLGVFGVSMSAMQGLVKRLGKDHALAGALWSSGWYEGQLLAALVDDPQRVTRRQMNAWAGDFDNWAVCDTACFHLFDRTPFAWEKVVQWARSPREFVKRAAFALLASLTAHDKAALDEEFLAMLPLIEAAAHDERNFVKKAVNWSLRCIGKRSPALNAAAIDVAEALAQAQVASCRWVGKDALRELRGPKVRARLGRRPA
jgi:3-methyladenine DNA glycosylase AlkD